MNIIWNFCVPLRGEKIRENLFTSSKKFDVLLGIERWDCLQNPTTVLMTVVSRGGCYLVTAMVQIVL